MASLNSSNATSRKSLDKADEMSKQIALHGSTSSTVDYNFLKEFQQLALPALLQVLIDEIREMKLIMIKSEHNRLYGKGRN